MANTTARAAEQTKAEQPFSSDRSASTKTVPAHTPLPWRVVHELRDYDEAVCDLVNATWVIKPPGANLGNWHADAALIVRAVNNHAKLVQAVRDSLDYLSCIPESAVGGDDDAGVLCKRLRAVLSALEG